VSTDTRMIQDEWLLSYAAGALSPGRALMVASHTNYHDQLQQKVSDAEAIGGAILESTAPSKVDELMLEQLLDRIDKQSPSVDYSAGIKSRVLPPPLAEFVGGDIDALRWRFMGPGMGYVRLMEQTNNNEQLWLLRANGGVQVPEHGHEGEEWTLVLKGSYQDGTGRYSKGDISLLDGEVEHQPLIDEDEECICLVLTQNPLRFKGAIPKIAQSFIGL